MPLRARPAESAGDVTAPGRLRTKSVTLLTSALGEPRKLMILRAFMASHTLAGKAVEMLQAMRAPMGLKQWVITLLVALGSLALLPAAADAAQRKPSAKKPAASAKSSRAVKAAPQRKSQARRVSRKIVVAPPRLSFGQLSGLHAADDPLALQSSVALVIDQDTDEVLFSKNPQAVLPIASITKLMTALVVSEAALPLDQLLTVTQDDVDTEKGSRSRLVVGTQLTRGEMLHLALMASENRAAHALGRHYPGGQGAFVAAMNRKARELGMSDTRFVEPTGLSSANQSSARDLAVLVKTAHHYPLIRELSTSLEHEVLVGERALQFRNTNALVKNPLWEIGLQKTGYISEAGRCVVMQAQLAGRKLIMVLLDSAGRYSRVGDAERLRKWLGEQHGSAMAAQPNS
jgi:D-alanyl-D-alanine endopeptidase (penicillin-binding protein 7)